MTVPWPVITGYAERREFFEKCRCFEGLMHVKCINRVEALEELILNLQGDSGSPCLKS